MYLFSFRFEDDDLFDDKPRAGSAPAGGRRGQGAASSFLEDMITKDDTDWLDMASGIIIICTPCRSFL